MTFLLTDFLVPSTCIKTIAHRSGVCNIEAAAYYNFINKSFAANAILMDFIFESTRPRGRLHPNVRYDRFVFFQRIRENNRISYHLTGDSILESVLGLVFMPHSSFNCHYVLFHRNTYFYI